MPSWLLHPLRRNDLFRWPISTSRLSSMHMVLGHWMGVFNMACFQDTCFHVFPAYCMFQQTVWFSAQNSVLFVGLLHGCCSDSSPFLVIHISVTARVVGYYRGRGPMATLCL
jgi:hypothetical protein